MYSVHPSSHTYKLTDMTLIPRGTLMVLLEPKGGPHDVYGKFLVGGRVGWVYWPEAEAADAT